MSVQWQHTTGRTSCDRTCTAGRKVVCSASACRSTHFAWFCVHGQLQITCFEVFIGGLRTEFVTDGCSQVSVQLPGMCPLTLGATIHYCPRKTRLKQTTNATQVWQDFCGDQHQRQRRCPPRFSCTHPTVVHDVNVPTKHGRRNCRHNYAL